MLSAGGSGVPHHRRIVIFRCGKYQAGARSGFRSGCGHPLGAFRKQLREQKRRARVGHHHGRQTCMGYRGYQCDRLPGLGPGGTLAVDLNDGDDFFVVMRARRLAVAAAASHTCLPPSVSVIVNKLTGFRVQTAARVNKWMPTVSEIVGVFMSVKVMSPVFSKGSGAGGGRGQAAPERGVVGLK